jgi:hypothetical protein
MGDEMMTTEEWNDKPTGTQAMTDEELIKALRLAADRIEQLRKQNEELERELEAIYMLNPDEEDMAKEAGVYRIVTTYKELKGET